MKFTIRTVKGYEIFHKDFNEHSIPPLSDEEREEMARIMREKAAHTITLPLSELPPAYWCFLNHGCLGSQPV